LGRSLWRWPRPDVIAAPQGHFSITHKTEKKKEK
jgi:hypothetical protein